MSLETLDESSLPEELTCPVGVPDCSVLAQLRQMQAEREGLLAQVRTDGLTGVFNYRHFADLLEQEVERSRRSGLPLVLAMVDLDHFKQVNDRWGHEVGNRVLIHLAGILRDGVRRIDSVCRYGGEEFALVLPGTPLPKALPVAERIREQIEASPLWVGRDQVRVTASVGLAAFPARDVQSGQQLLERADALLYQAKAEGRNRVCHVTPAPQVPIAQVTPEEKSALWDS